MSASTPADPLREAFEEAVFREHFVKHVRIDSNRQFWDLSQQKRREEVFERDGDDYKDEAISAMWFGWRLATKPVAWRAARAALAHRSTPE